MFFDEFCLVCCAASFTTALVAFLVKDVVIDYWLLFLYDYVTEDCLVLAIFALLSIVDWTPLD